MKIYLAGPDVFYADVEQRFARLEAECQLFGFTPVRPVEGSVTDKSKAALGIFKGNVARIRDADVVLANLEPFRGAVEPDSGTVFEVGLAYGLDKPVYGYGVAPQIPLKERVAAHFGAREGAAGLVDDQFGALVEDFDLPLNLMLGVSVACYGSSLEALEALALQVGGRK